MKPYLLVSLAFSSFMILETTFGVSSFLPAASQRIQVLAEIKQTKTLSVNTRAVPVALVGKYVGTLKPVVNCGTAAPITIVVAKSGTVSSTTAQTSGPNGVSARLSTSVNPPLFTGEYTTGGSQGFWQGQIVGKEIIGRAGVGTCRFIFFKLNKV